MNSTVAYVQTGSTSLVHCIDVEKHGEMEIQAACGFVPASGYWAVSWRMSPIHLRHCPRCLTRLGRNRSARPDFMPVRTCDAEALHEAWHKDSQFMCLDSQTADEHMDLIRYVYTVATEAASA